ncbi:MAG TPA: hypothetical protein VNI84_15845 [Pyrinomonadaceae bacterium]|nr:hypothetical protein [Pyrinomonadaceae bacterium]
MITCGKTQIKKKQKGFSTAEFIVVFLVISILFVLALPQLIASRRQSRFSEMQRQIVAFLTEAKEKAILQSQPVSFRYDNSAKRIVIYGGGFGALGDSKNKVADLAGRAGLDASEVVYGRLGGVATPLLDTSNMTILSGGVVDITFQSAGSVSDGSNNPVNNALCFYNINNPQATAFAVSILGADGRIKTWRYSKSLKTYV